LTISLAKAGTFLNVDEDKRIAKAKMPSENVIFTLTIDMRVSLYQIDRRIEKKRDIVLPNILNFDIFEGKYFIVYREESIVEVYIIEMYIYLSFKMRLPLY
jgi:hypothetical protein